MPVTGPLSHLDISVGNPARSIAFYDAFLAALGFRRTEGFTSEFAGANPTRGWRLETFGDVTFGIEVRSRLEHTFWTLRRTIQVSRDTGRDTMRHSMPIRMA
jgi:hypothetical protein